MLTLGLETATSACAAALWCGRERRVLAVRAEPMARGQAERLVPLVQELLAEAGVGFADIHRYGATIGPGTFTGLRIGLAAARGLALASARPLAGITSFEAVAHGLDPAVRAGRTLLACVESRRDDLFLQPFGEGLRPLAEPADVLPADLPAWAARHLPPGPLVLAGDAAARAVASLGGWAGDVAVRPSTGAAEAVAVARLTAELSEAELAARPAQPFYLRPPDVTMPKARE